MVSDPVLSDEKFKNTSTAPVQNDEDCLHKASWQSDMGKIEQTTNINTATKQKYTKKNRLLANPDVKRWYENLSRGSELTADVRVRRLGLFCQAHHMTPSELAELGMRDLRAVTDLIEDHITSMEQEGYAPGYIGDTVKAVKSLLRHFEVEIKRRIKISNLGSTPTLENEKVPESLELTELFNRSEVRSGAMMSLIAKAGLRPEVLGNHNGTDGLRIKDLPDLAIVEGLVIFTSIPPRIKVRKALSKTRHEYFTFITDMGVKRLLAYLNARILAGDALAPDSPVIAPASKHPMQRGQNSTKPFLPTQRIRVEIKNTMRPRFQWRPYVLRAFFDTQLLIAESRGKIAHDFRVFFMGHKGSIEATYTTNKGILPKALTDAMRDSFRRSEELLDLEKGAEDPQEEKREQIRQSIQCLPPEKLAAVQKLVSELAGCNTSSVL